MAVLFDAVGGGAVSTALTASPFTKTWTHTASGTNRAVLVAFDAYATLGSSGTTIAVTYGGVAMTQLKTIGPNNATTTAGFSAVYGLLNPPTGAQTVSVTITHSGMYVSGFAGNSFSYTGVASFGTVVTSYGSGTAASLAVTGGVTGGLDFALLSCALSASPVGYNQTGRYAANGASAGVVAGDAAGASSVTFSASWSGTYSWDAIGVPMLPVSAVTTPSNLFFSMF